MSEKEWKNEMRYQNAMAAARHLLEQGIIDRDDYREFDTKMANKYAPTLGSLFSDVSAHNP